MIQKKEINKLLDNLQDYLFPGFFSNKVIGKDDIVFDLCKMFKRLEVNKYSASQFVNKIDEIKKLLLKDIEATFNGDPASKSYEEIIVSYPGIYAIMIYRLAHELYVNEVPMLPRLISEIAHSKTGIDIHPGATIGEYFFIDHGTGVVIGETTIIGNNVRIYQGVTLGALSLQNAHEIKNKKRHPTIKDNVIIYANASILGGDTVIGNNVIIGGNVFITSSIEDNKIVTFEKENYKIKDRRDYNG